LPFRFALYCRFTFDFVTLSPHVFPEVTLFSLRFTAILTRRHDFRHYRLPFRCLRLMLPLPFQLFFTPPDTDTAYRLSSADSMFRSFVFDAAVADDDSQAFAISPAAIFDVFRYSFA